MRSLFRLLLEKPLLFQCTLEFIAFVCKIFVKVFAVLIRGNDCVILVELHKFFGLCKFSKSFVKDLYGLCESFVWSLFP